MDPLPCSECGHDATDFIAHNEELKAQNRTLRTEVEKLKEHIVQMRIDRAEDVNDDTKLGLLGLKGLMLFLITLTLSVATCGLVPDVMKETGHTELTRSMEAVNTAFKSCEYEAKGDEERSVCFKAYKDGMEELIQLVKTKQSDTVQNSMAP